MSSEKNRRILVIDDNRAIHDDFRKILATASTSSRLSEMETALFSDEPKEEDELYGIDSAYQGEEGVEFVKRAKEAGAPYSLSFVDMRMPPGWDGVQTIEELWEVDREIQIVICTAYSDYAWDDLLQKFGATDRLLLLKKPFDVAEVRQLACALTTKWHMSRRTEALESQKDEFISTVSHELRTPLTSIRGALGLLEGGIMGALPEEAMEIVQIARTNTDRLIRLLNDLLDLEKIEAGKLELKRKRIEIPALVTLTLGGVRATAAEEGVALHADVGALEGLQGDEDRLVQVLTNLVSNAIKFSPRGGIVHVKVEVVASDRVRFSVTDQGEGIAASHLPRLFGKFEQVDSSETRSKGGTGLGLAISKAIVEQHGGEIGVESRVGRGSTFWFELPRA